MNTKLPNEKAERKKTTSFIIKEHGNSDSSFLQFFTLLPWSITTETWACLTIEATAKPLRYSSSSINAMLIFAVTWTCSSKSKSAFSLRKEFTGIYFIPWRKVHAFKHRMMSSRSNIHKESKRYKLLKCRKKLMNIRKSSKQELISQLNEPAIFEDEECWLFTWGRTNPNSAWSDG